MSCVAVVIAELGGNPRDDHWDWGRLSRRSRAVQFLKTLGCKTGSIGQFSDFVTPEDKQGARYAWLMFASMLAEEQGL